MKTCESKEDTSGCISNSAKISMLSSAMEENHSMGTTNNMYDVTNIIEEAVNSLDDKKMAANEKYEVLIYIFSS